MKRGQYGCTMYHGYVVTCAPHKNDRAHTPLVPSNQNSHFEENRKAISKKAMKKKTVTQKIN